MAISESSRSVCSCLDREQRPASQSQPESKSERRTGGKGLNETKGRPSAKTAGGVNGGVAEAGKEGRERGNGAEISQVVSSTDDAKFSVLSATLTKTPV